MDNICAASACSKFKNVASKIKIADFCRYHKGIKLLYALLAEIRKVKRKKPKANTYKYTPKKYRRVSKKYGYPSKKRKFAGRQVAVYGYAKTNRHPRPYSARFEFYGSGKELFQAVRQAHNGIVPRYEWAFVKCSARGFLNKPTIYGERGVWVWD